MNSDKSLNNRIYQLLLFHYSTQHSTGDDKEATSSRIIRGVDVVALWQDSEDTKESRLYYYGNDEQGSIKYLLDERGEIENQYRYDAFGVILKEREEVNNPIKYTGQEYDKLSEQYYLRARFYNPVTGRFLQEDRYRGDGLNLYAYCRNNPVVYCDTSGYSSDLSSQYQKKSDGNESVEGTGDYQISSRNAGKGNPNAINHFDVDLNNRQQNLLDELSGYDSRTVVNKSDVNLKDLSALTAKTGDEFAMFTRGSRRLIIRGDATHFNIDTTTAIDLYNSGYKWSGHTHPGTGFNVKMPSEGDLFILEQFNQSQSSIYDSSGQYNIFGGQ